MPLRAGVPRQEIDHACDFGVRDRLGARPRRHVMVGDGEGEVGPRDRPAPLSHLLEGVEGAFMQEVPVDEEQAVAAFTRHDHMAFPQLVDDGQRP